MTEAVLDASALIAFLRDEPGAHGVAAVLRTVCISAVNLAEVLVVLSRSKPLDAVAEQVGRLRIPVVPFDSELARITASLVESTHHLGLSLGDRACLALARSRSLPAYTTDRTWDECGLPVKIVQLR